jgi:hypothetical protein
LKSRFFGVQEQDDPDFQGKPTFLGPDIADLLQMGREWTCVGTIISNLESWSRHVPVKTIKRYVDKARVPRKRAENLLDN